MVGANQVRWTGWVSNPSFAGGHLLTASCPGPNQRALSQGAPLPFDLTTIGFSTLTRSTGPALGPVSVCKDDRVGFGGLFQRKFGGGSADKKPQMPILLVFRKVDLAEKGLYSAGPFGPRFLVPLPTSGLTRSRATLLSGNMPCADFHAKSNVSVVVPPYTLL
jgi:hypothetical protein